MSITDAEDFVHSGPDTPAGRYLRRVWQPIYESEKLRVGQAVPIRVMCEDFTLYRGEDSKAYVTVSRCPHRGTQLSTGWVEDDCIRCIYHGWKFDAQGNCVDQPAEPHTFAHKIKIRTYPVEEQLGLIFAYFGELPSPPLPRWSELDELDKVASMAVIPCNYFQSAENIVDDVHVGFVHATTQKAGQTAKDRKPPAVAAEEASHGIKMTYTKPDRVEHSYFLMPNSHVVSYYLDYVVPATEKDQFRMLTLFWYVPIDDVSHNHVMVTAGIPDIIDLMREEKKEPHCVADDIHAVLSGRADWHKNSSRANRRPDMVRLQDGVSVVGQGSIADRSLDRLGASDAGVILLRKLWMRELRNLKGGGPITPFMPPAQLPR